VQTDQDIPRLLGEAAAVGAAEAGLPGECEGVMAKIGTPRGGERGVPAAAAARAAQAKASSRVFVVIGL